MFNKVSEPSRDFVSNSPTTSDYIPPEHQLISPHAYNSKVDGSTQVQTANQNNNSHLARYQLPENANLIMDQASGSVYVVYN